jgi:hypothetical protein
MVILRVFIFCVVRNVKEEIKINVKEIKLLKPNSFN